MHNNLSHRWTAFVSLLFVLLTECFTTSVSFAGEKIGSRICLLSDLNGPYGSIALPSGVHSGVARLAQMNCDLALAAGDLVAGQDTSLSNERLQSMWNEWERVVADPFLSRGVPIISALGNHDASAERSSSGGFVFARERMAAASAWNAILGKSAYSSVEWLSREQFPFFYAFKFKSAGVIVFDGSSAGEVSRNRVWLERQLDVLASDAAVKTRIVIGHLPLFAVAKGRETVGNILFDSVELYQLFNRYRVDFYVSGHHHAFYPARPALQYNDYGTVLLSLGAMGDGPRKLLNPSAPPARHSMSVLDISQSILDPDFFAPQNFNLQTLSPFDGLLQPSTLLPERLESFDGRGRPVDLRRIDL